MARGIDGLVGGQIFARPLSCSCHRLVFATSNTISHAYLILPEDTLAHTRLALAEEEKIRVDEGQARTYEVSPSTFLLLGIDIQGIQ